VTSKVTAFTKRGFVSLVDASCAKANTNILSSTILDTTLPERVARCIA
jgi:hypothetical protein